MHACMALLSMINIWILRCVSMFKRDFKSRGMPLNGANIIYSSKKNDVQWHEWWNRSNQLLQLFVCPCCSNSEFLLCTSRFQNPQTSNTKQRTHERTQSVANKETVNIPKFGKFVPIETPARIYNNIQNPAGPKIHTPAKTMVKFRAFKHFKDCVAEGKAE